MPFAASMCLDGGENAAEVTSYCCLPPGTKPPTIIDMFLFVNSATNCGKLGAVMTLTLGLTHIEVHFFGVYARAEEDGGMNM